MYINIWANPPLFTLELDTALFEFRFRGVQLLLFALPRRRAAIYLPFFQPSFLGSEDKSQCLSCRETKGFLRNIFVTLPYCCLVRRPGGRITALPAGGCALRLQHIALYSHVPKHWANPPIATLELDTASVEFRPRGVQ